MNNLSLFSGIGGLDLGLEASGIHTIAQCEWDPYCTKVLEKHWPHTPRWGDIRSIAYDWLATLPPIDLVSGGFPCQPFSVSGKIKGTHDDRYLWPEMARIIELTRPKWVIAENVPGLLSAQSGTTFHSILLDLSALGYDVLWESITAEAVGSPQYRDRVFIMATPSLNYEHFRSILAEALQNLRETSYTHRLNLQRRGTTNLPEPQTPTETRLPSGSHAGFRADAWTDQCRLGRDLHGIPCGLDSCTGWDCSIDRIVSTQPNRKARLISLGNSIIPSIAYAIGQTIGTYEQ